MQNQVLEKLVEDIYRQKLNKAQRQRLFDQLHYFAKLRNLEHVLDTVMNTIRLTKKQVEEDPFFLRGQLQMAIAMKKQGYKPEEIVKVSKLSLQQIKNAK